LDLLRLCQIDPPRHPSQFGKGVLVRNGNLRFGFVSLSPKAQFVTTQGIEYSGLCSSQGEKIIDVNVLF